MSDLLKPFATALAIILGIFVAQLLFHLQLNSLDLNFGGSTASLRKVEAKAVDAGNALVNVNDRMAGLQKELDALTQKVTGVAPPAVQLVEASGISGIAGSPASDGTRTNDTLAALFKPVVGNVSPLAGSEGFVFIGNRLGDTLSLDRPGLGVLTGTALSSLDQLQPDQSYQTHANLVLRAGQPENNAAYFNGQRSLGILPRGTQVTLLAPPQPIRRSDALIQMWAHVRVND